MRPAFALPLLAALAACAAPSLAQEASNPSFNLVNRGNAVINEIYATPSTNDRWGGDRLARSNLPAGQTFPVRLPSGTCVYDLRVVFAGRPAEERRRVDLCQVDSVTFPGTGRATQGSGATTPGRGSATTNDPSFRLVNRGRAEVNEVYASPSGEEDWGEDRLGETTVRAGSTRVVRLPNGECTWDVRVVFANGEALERRRVDLCAITDFRVP